MGKDIRNAQRMERAYESRHERRQCPACGKWFVNSKARGWACSLKCRQVLEPDPNVHKI